MTLPCVGDDVQSFFVEIYSIMIAFSLRVYQLMQICQLFISKSSLSLPLPLPLCSRNQPTMVLWPWVEGMPSEPTGLTTPRRT